MVTNNEAVDNFLNGKRNLAAYQFSQLIQKIASSQHQQDAGSSTLSQPSSGVESLSSCSSSDQQTATNSSPSANAETVRPQHQLNSDEIAFNYAMINLFTGCPSRSSVIFSDLVKRYPRNPRLWLRLAESMLAVERAKMTEFEHVQQLSYPHSRDHQIKTKNKPILIKINPHYCQQQIQQQIQPQRGTPFNFLVTVKSHLQKSLELINEYNDISLLTDDIPNPPMDIQQHLHQNNQIIRQTLAIGSPVSTIGSSGTPRTANNLESGSPNDVHCTSKLSHQLSYANPYHSISRSDLYHLRNKVQLNLAYICLCMGEPLRAINHTTQCLKASPLGYDKVLAHLYHAEACILAEKVEEAIQFLNLEVLNLANNLAAEHPVMTGNTKAVVYGDEMLHQLESDAPATVVTYNLSVAFAAKGQFSTANKILLQSIQPSKPNPMQIIICLLYIQLQQGQLESAKRTILNNLPQFR